MVKRNQKAKDEVKNRFVTQLRSHTSAAKLAWRRRVNERRSHLHLNDILVCQPINESIIWLRKDTHTARLFENRSFSDIFFCANAGIVCTIDHVSVGLRSHRNARNQYVQPIGAKLVAWHHHNQQLGIVNASVRHTDTECGSKILCL